MRAGASAGSRSPLADDRQRFFSEARSALPAVRLVEGRQPRESGNSQTERPPNCGTRPAPASSAGRRLRPDGRRIAFSIEQGGRTTLYVMNMDGAERAGGHRIAGACRARRPGRRTGNRSPPAAVEDGVPRLYRVPLDGSPTGPLDEEYAVDPVWAPDGRFIVYSGPDIGTTFSVRAVAADGRPVPPARDHADPRRPTPALPAGPARAAGDARRDRPQGSLADRSGRLEPNIN